MIGEKPRGWSIELSTEAEMEELGGSAGLRASAAQPYMDIRICFDGAPALEMDHCRQTTLNLPALTNLVRALNAVEEVRKALEATNPFTPFPYDPLG